jgi:hypothetical protein
MPRQYVRPYAKTNKHDAADAEGAARQCSGPACDWCRSTTSSSFAPDAAQNPRRLIAERTGTINAIREHMAEFGMVAAPRDAGLETLLAIIADDDDERLPALARAFLVLQLEHVRQIEARIAALDGGVVRQAREDDTCRRLTETSGGDRAPARRSERLARCLEDPRAPERVQHGLAEIDPLPRLADRGGLPGCQRLRRPGRRASSALNHAQGWPSRPWTSRTSGRAPCISWRRREPSPRLLIPSSRSLPPAVCWRGVRPSQAAKLRPLLRSQALPTVATMAVAMTGPIPRAECRPTSAARRRS